MKVAGQALERFIIHVIKSYSTDINLSDIYKSKTEYEGNKIDFVSNYNIYGTDINIHFANQLTAKDNHSSKNDDLSNLAYLLDNPDFNTKHPETIAINNDTYRKENIPDLPILFSIKNGLQRIGQNQSWNNPLSNSYKEIGIKKVTENVGKGKRIKSSNKTDFDSIGVSYPVILSYFLEQIKNIDLNSNCEEKNIKKGKGYMDIFYNSKKSIYSVIFKKDKNKETSYLMDFYITEKFLKKIGINHQIERSYIKKKKKTINRAEPKKKEVELYY
ncbi:MAG: hypothetical protein Q9M94_01610 [Candidatus Gracilibacteria bacterium]|nr:hypothetical protein [Candidatus Gracilibacteria bacterium]